MDKKKRIGIIGHFGGGYSFLDGQTVKTKILYEELVKAGYKDLFCVDTYYKQVNKAKLLWDSFRCILKCKTIIILLIILIGGLKALKKKNKIKANEPITLEEINIEEQGVEEVVLPVSVVLNQGEGIVVGSDEILSAGEYIVNTFNDEEFVKILQSYSKGSDIENALKNKSNKSDFADMYDELALVCLIVKYVPFMKSLKEAGDARLEAEKQLALAYSLEDNGAPKKEMTFAKRLLFWLPMILTAIIACLDYIPLARLSMDLFPDAAGNVYTFYFPARMMNAVFLWAVINGAVGLVVWALTTAGENLYYIISSKITGKECKADWSKFKGLAVKPIDLLKALGLAVLMFLVFYGILQIVYMLTHQDFRFMLISASPLQALNSSGYV